MGIRPATPGTIVVLAATVLLILVSVSTPLLKSIYFLEANLSSGSYSGTVRLGAWGYCVGDTCTSPKLGYSLNVAELLDINGRLSGVSNSVLKWITYLMILHPIAAAFGVVSVIFGLLAHMHGFAGTALTTCFASFAATFSLLAFVFDIAVFVVAKQRIESSSVGGNANLGPAVWMTLAAMVLFGLSGCFFGCGACVIRKQRAGREASEKSRPLPDEEYGSKLRGEALAAHERDKAYAAHHTRQEGVLPAFTEHERDKEDIPLNSMQAVAFDDEGYQPRPYPPQQSSEGSTGMITGVGQGYGRRHDEYDVRPGSYPEPESAYPPFPPPAPTGTPNNAGRGTGVGSRLAADVRAQRGYASEPTTEAFQGMYNAPASTSPAPTGNPGHYQSPSAYDHSNTSQSNPSASMPVPHALLSGPRDLHAQPISPTYQGEYPTYPPAPPAALTPGAYDYKGRTPISTSPPPVQPQPSYYVQNPSPSTHQAESSVHSHDTTQVYDQANNQYGLRPERGHVQAPSTHAPTYYTYEDPQQQQNQLVQHPQYQYQREGGTIDYNLTPAGGPSSSEYHAGYQTRY